MPVTVHTPGRGIWWVGLFKIADFGDTTGMTRMSPELWQRIPPEAQVIFLEMAETIKRLETRVEELERRLGQTPQNSSLPPSSRHPHAKPAPPSKRRSESAAGGGEKVRHRDQIKSRRVAGVNSSTFVCVWTAVV
jgi:hypothetical protein